MCSNVADFFSEKNIELEGLDYIKDFLLLWGYVESCYFKNELTKGVLTSFIDKMAEEHSEKLECFATKIGDKFEYFRSRYSENTQYDLNALFNERDGEIKNKVAEFISASHASPYEGVYSCMHIVRRLRNNLFHGTKAASILRAQESNFNAACQILLAFCAVFPEPPVGD